MNSTCNVYNNKNFLNVDQFICNLLKFEYDLYYYDFGYYCMGPLALILLISIFGKIKESYRWLILNQVIWDLFTSTNYACYTPVTIKEKPSPSCFYLTKTYLINVTNLSRIFDTFATDVITYNTYSSLFLLTSLRYLALYFPRIYDKFTKGKKIFFTIILFNCFSFLFDIDVWVLYFQVNRLITVLDECALKQNSTRAICSAQKYYENDTALNIFLNATFITMLIKYLKPVLFIFLSITATLMIIWKITKQAKFQFKHNRKDFFASLRITIVICLQTIIYCCVFFIEAFSKLIPEIINYFQLKIRTSRNFVNGRDYTGYWDLRLPQWFDGPNGLTSENSRQMIVQFRILIETIIILTIMTGYREAVINAVKFLYKFIRNPIKYLKWSKFNINNSNVSGTTLF